MKILTIAIPCYNSEAYMRTCIESLLVDKDSIEIIVVNDGSTKDHTAQIADDYAMRYPDTIKAIHKENGGHGSAVNAGFENASGKYFKVVDSDDKLDPHALIKVVEFLKTHDVDMLLTNFVYDKQGSRNKKIMDYRGTLPKNKIITWNTIKRFNVDQYIMMHAIIYKIDVLRECNLKLPLHTFYVDNIYAYVPLPYVKTMYYMDLTLYYYFIGRDDQSVNEKIMISRIDQQIKVNQIIFNEFDLTKFQHKKLRSYMYHQLAIISAVSSILLIRDGSAENIKKYKDLWAYFKQTNYAMYKHLKFFTVAGRALTMPGKLGRGTILKIYKMLQKHMGFN